jgi:hypothetical protein
MDNTTGSAAGDATDGSITSHLNDDVDTTLVSSTERNHDQQVVIDDWSQSGRGSHVDFEINEQVPIVQGRYMPQGSPVTHPTHST